MEITKVTIGTETFRIFEVTLFAGTPNEVIVPAAEEKLDALIQEKIESDRYHEVQTIDETYSYVVPQVIADSEDEALITVSIEDVYE